MILTFGIVLRCKACVDMPDLLSFPWLARTRIIRGYASNM
jgi:hypothetical protein